jgi:hypothetical protein
MRWERYVRTVGDDQVVDLWAQFTGEPLLVVIGGGFDPRVPRALARLIEVAKGPVDVARLGLNDEATDPAMQDVAAANRQEVDELVATVGGQVYDQSFPSVHARRSAGANVSRAFHEAGYLDRYQRVVVDVSGLPRSIFFPFIRGLLQSTGAGWSGDLHVAACDSPEGDLAVLEEGAEAAGALGGFAGPPDDEPWAATVWVPVLGEGAGEQLAAVLEAIEPLDEVVPVVPFPAANPRRGDDLLLEHRELLIDRIAVEPRNLLYASESNPFDLYRSITQLYEHHRFVLRPLGAPKFILSTHSSKLLSIGVLLAAYELGLQVMHVSPSRYGLRADADPAALRSAGQLVDLWLAGEPYR